MYALGTQLLGRTRRTKQTIKRQRYPQFLNSSHMSHSHPSGPFSCQVTTGMPASTSRLSLYTVHTSPRPIHVQRMSDICNGKKQSQRWDTHTHKHTDLIPLCSFMCVLFKLPFQPFRQLGQASSLAYNNTPQMHEKGSTQTQATMAPEHRQTKCLIAHMNSHELATWAVGTCAVQYGIEITRNSGTGARHIQAGDEWWRQAAMCTPREDPNTPRAQESKKNSHNAHPHARVVCAPQPPSRPDTKTITRRSDRCTGHETHGP